jgi:CRISPR-associated endonuclease Cas2
MNYLVCYDLPESENRLRTKIAKICKNYGLLRIQYSVFWGVLTSGEARELATRCADVAGDRPIDIRFIAVCADCHGRSYAYIRNLGIQTSDAVQLDSDPLYNVLVHPNIGWDPSDRRVQRQYPHPQSGEIPTISQPLQSTNPFTPIQISHENSIKLEESSPPSKLRLKANKKSPQKTLQNQNTGIGDQNQSEAEEVDVVNQPDVELDEILKKPQDQLTFDEIMHLTGGPSETPLDDSAIMAEGGNNARKSEGEQTVELKIVKRPSNTVDGQECRSLTHQNPTNQPLADQHSTSSNDSAKRKTIGVICSFDEWDVKGGIANSPELVPLEEESKFESQSSSPTEIYADTEQILPISGDSPPSNPQDAYIVRPSLKRGAKDIDILFI